MITLGGNVCIRNGDALDYCWRESILSLLPVCDAVTVCDWQSSDGTQEAILEWMTREPKLRLCVYTQPNPIADLACIDLWMNFCREHVLEDFVFHLDADEVLSEESHSFIHEFKRNTPANLLRSLQITCYTFWRDAGHISPPDRHGRKVIRIVPQSVFLPNDKEDQRFVEATRIAVDSPIEVFHYGFLRHKEAYFEKCRQLHTFRFGGFTDQRLLDVEKLNGRWMEQIRGLAWSPVPFACRHPATIQPWLKERGHLP